MAVGRAQAARRRGVASLETLRDRASAVDDAVADGVRGSELERWDWRLGACTRCARGEFLSAAASLIEETVRDGLPSVRMIRARRRPSWRSRHRSG